MRHEQLKVNIMLVGSKFADLQTDCIEPKFEYLGNNSFSWPINTIFLTKSKKVMSADELIRCIIMIVFVGRTIT